MSNEQSEPESQLDRTRALFQELGLYCKIIPGLRAGEVWLVLADCEYSVDNYGTLDLNFDAAGKLIKAEIDIIRHC